MTLEHAYRYHRAATRSRANGYRTLATASEAIALARADIAAGTRRYMPETAGAGAEFTSGRDKLRFCNKPADMGLRFVAWSDECARIKHTGWFTRHDGYACDESVRGAVFLVPGRKGKTRAVAGFVECDGRDSWQNDGALIACEIADEITRDRWHENADMRDTANAADSMAERFAENAREYDTAWQAGARYRDNAERIAEARKESREIAAAARDNVKNNPVICSTLREKVAELRAEIRELIGENRELKAGDYSRGDDYLSFYTGNAELCAAFNDGAGAQVLA